MAIKGRGKEAIGFDWGMGQRDVRVDVLDKSTASNPPHLQRWVTRWHCGVTQASWNRLAALDDAQRHGR